MNRIKKTLQKSRLTYLQVNTTALTYKLLKHKKVYTNDPVNCRCTVGEFFNDLNDGEPEAWDKLKSISENPNDFIGPHHVDWKTSKPLAIGDTFTDNDGNVCKITEILESSDKHISGISNKWIPLK